MRKLLGLIGVLSEVLRLESVLVIPRNAIGNPPLVPLFVGARHYEILNFHLFELAHPEDEVLRSNLVAICLSDLRNTERKFSIRRIEDVLEIDEDTLGGLWTQIRDIVLVLDGPDRRLEHQIEG